MLGRGALWKLWCEQKSMLQRCLISSSGASVSLEHLALSMSLDAVQLLSYPIEPKPEVLLNQICACLGVSTLCSCYQECWGTQHSQCPHRGLTLHRRAWCWTGGTDATRMVQHHLEPVCCAPQCTEVSSATVLDPGWICAVPKQGLRLSSVWG